jgi:predicted dehydrogenase
VLKLPIFAFRQSPVRKITIATGSKFIEGDFITQTVTEYSRYSEDGSYITRIVGVPYAEPLTLELEAFIDAIKNDTIPPITGEDGLRALEIALTALELAHKGKDTS